MKEKKKRSRTHCQKIMVLFLENTTGMVQKPKLRQAEKELYHHQQQQCRGGLRQAQREHHVSMLVQAESKREHGFLC